MRSIRSTLLVAFVSLSAVMVAGAAIAAFYLESGTLRDNARSQLETLADIHHDRLEDYAAANQRNLALVASRTQLRRNLDAELTAPAAENVDGMNRILDDAASATGVVESVSVLSPAGTVLASSDRARIGADLSESVWFPSAVLDPSVGTIVATEDGLRGIHAAPMVLEDRLIGVALVVMLLEDLESVASVVAVGESQELLVAARDDAGVLRHLVPPRFPEGSAAPDESGSLAAAVAGFDASASNGRDYREAKVFSAARTLPSTGWGLEVKIDESEALQPIADLRRVMIGLVLGGIVFGALAAVFLSGRLAGPVRSLRDVARRISAGERELRAPTGRTRELSELALSFNEMADDLVSTNKGLMVRNEQLEQFVYVSSHDLKSPLRSITSFSQLIELEHSEELSDTARRYLDIVQSSAGRLHAVIEDLVAYLRIDPHAVSPSPVPLNEVLEDIVELRRPAIEADGDEVSIGDLPVVVGDRVMMRQLFDNLVGNALTYRRPDSVAEIVVSGSADDEFAVIRVDDAGIGIDPSHREQVFGVFERLHGHEVPGTGMGLAICSRIADAQGGSIEIGDSPLGGCRVTVTLPTR